MASVRAFQFRDEFVYHLFNRGVERRPIFTSLRDRERFTLLCDYYRFAAIPKSFSHYLNLPLEERTAYRATMDTLPLTIDILAYCLMPNHFHLLIKQRQENGITTAISTITNGYAKYFNTKHHRVGPLFQGPFRAVRVETDEQLVHLSRYIHLNPLIGGVIAENELFSYPWSSLPAYMGTTASSFVVSKSVLTHFPTIAAYKAFVMDHISYTRELDKVKHLILEKV